MRILAATDQWFPDAAGGSARLARDLAAALARRGNELTVLAPRSDVGEEPAVGVALERVLSRGRLPQTFTDPLEVRRHARRLGSSSFDVLLAHQSTMAAGLRALHDDAPLVFVYHGSGPRELAFDRGRLPYGPKRLVRSALGLRLQQLEKRAVRDAARVIVLSEFSRSLLCADHDIDPMRIAKVSGGVDTDAFTPGDGPVSARERLGVGREATLLFTARRLAPNRGIDQLLRALVFLPQEVTLVVAGEGPLADDLKRLQAELRLGERVHLVGRIPEAELRDWYRAADLFVLPTVAYEGFGLATIEALASGTPVLGTSAGATPELLMPLDQRLVVEDSDPEPLAEGLTRALELVGPDLRRRAREYACTHFAWDKVAEDWEAVLRDAGSTREPWVEPSLTPTPRSMPRSRRRTQTTDLLVVAGARPNFMKASAIVRAAERIGLTYALVHTGQHYDSELSEVFFTELGLPDARTHLGVGSGSHAEQTARIMVAFDQELTRLDPAIVVVVGDVNSTLACALVAVKEQYPVAHVEAGLRCHDRWMPEEINRKLCDHMADYLFTTSRDADENLRLEGIPPERIAFVGNTMIDTLLRFADVARSRRVPERLGIGGRYALATLHRPENVDAPETLASLVQALVRLSDHVPVALPLHPRTADRLNRFGLEADLANAPGIVISPPLGYLDFVGLLADASVVLTDSGGVQEETTVLGVPCLTLRDATERPVTVEQGTNRVVGRDPNAILAAATSVLLGGSRPGRIPELWDGQAGDRIVARLEEDVRELSEALNA
jgi:UDP-N-acetylglucosamine 2-epimerase (non-hydrolysing)